MKLAVSMIVRNELGRYLQQTVEHALTYCDVLVALDDRSDDQGFEYLASLNHAIVGKNTGTSWVEHEGRARQALLDMTLRTDATHILALDADEIVPDGAKLREHLEQDDTHQVWSLRMVEIWDRYPWQARVDGGWRPHPVNILYRNPGADCGWHIRDRALACGRVPAEVGKLARSAGRDLPFDVLHLGWSDHREREARAARYRELDGGRFHAKAHLDSILDEARTVLGPYPDPGL